MAKEFNVACPSCSAIFSVPAELAGEMAECAECNAVFEIPCPPQAPEEAASGGNYEETPTGAITGVASDGEGVTNTVRLSRTSIGMIPKVKDAFNFDQPANVPRAGAPAPRPSPAPQPRAAAPKPSIVPPQPRPSITPPPRPAPQQAAPPPPQAPAAGHGTSISIKKTGGKSFSAPQKKMAIQAPPDDDEPESEEVNEEASTRVQAPVNINSDDGFSDGRSDKSYATALILCWVGGWLGLHRFFLGQTVMGVAMLCTLGGCGVWWLIDFAMIVFGVFKDKDGNFLKN